jgi:hypothetical protein
VFDEARATLKKENPEGMAVWVESGGAGGGNLYVVVCAIRELGRPASTDRMLLKHYS